MGRLILGTTSCIVEKFMGGRVFNNFLSWINSLFNKRKAISLGLYGSPNTGKTTLANKISLDWLGEPMGSVSEIPHETREVTKKERITMESYGKTLDMTLLDMPGIASKVDYRDFVSFGVNPKEARTRAKEATRGIIEAIKWLEDVDAALVIMDSSQDPYTQVNLTILGNLEAKDIPVILVANKVDRRDAKPDRIREAFPQYSIVEISALTGKNMDTLYETLTTHLR
ncbi:MAG: Era-like GTP-binding protein [Candidatus Micrarchaeota archaeon]